MYSEFLWYNISALFMMQKYVFDNFNVIVIFFMSRSVPKFRSNQTLAWECICVKIRKKIINAFACVLKSWNTHTHVFFVRVAVTQFKIVSQYVLESSYSWRLNRKYWSYESCISIVGDQSEY